MTITEQTLQRGPEANPDERRAFRDAGIEGFLQRSTAARLFESWALDLGMLATAVACGRISEAAFFAALRACRERLEFYGAAGQLARDVDRLTAVLAGISDLPDGAGATTEKQDFSAPESGSGTEVATSNSNSNSKRIRNPSVMFAI